jgi:hypothetical protein
MHDESELKEKYGNGGYYLIQNFDTISEVTFTVPQSKAKECIETVKDIAEPNWRQIKLAE